MNYYRILERKVAQFFNAESVLFFPDGYLALVALLRNLVLEDDLLFLQEPVEGMIPDTLEILQRQYKNLQVRVLADDSFTSIPSSVSRVVILANGVCENTCSVAPIEKWKKQLNLLWKKAHIPSLMILDDSSGVGLLGPNHRGTFDHFGITANEVPDPNGGVQYFFSGSLAETFGTSGGFIVGRKKWLRIIHQTEPCCCARNEMPLSGVVAAEKALQLVAEADRHERLWENVQILHEKLNAYGIAFTSDPLLPFVLAKVPNPKEVWKKMTLRGCRVGLTHFTKKPKLCLAVNSEHKADEIEYLAQSLEFVLAHKEEGEEPTPQN
ncbi:MAG: aminotransferase class I/II-fold pyridoxal phosphate-dependent enzyme [Thermoguttaceae bacterium]|nr:aminotransferase class I/II-fold pyridoxal phosphate-dependent enzyme [Thermoguttaceae bacterium]